MAMLHVQRLKTIVIYVDIELKETIYFINVYAKNEQDDLTEEEKKAFKAVIKILKEE